MNDNIEPESIGRVNTVLVANEGKAIITSIIAGIIETNLSERIKFTGIVEINQKTKDHINQIIIPHLDEILQKFGIEKQTYSLSVKNISATSSSDTEFAINGYSADAPIFLALLSASLKLKIDKQTVITGHISSEKGDISQVKGLTEKLETVVFENKYNNFIYPAMDGDNSLKILKPKEYDTSNSKLRKERTNINLIEVKNTYELIQNAVTIESIVNSSLDMNYFEKQKITGEGYSDQIFNYFVEENNKRFWNVIEELVFSIRTNQVHHLINKYLEYFINNKKYPNNFGAQLNKIIRSLPLSTKKMAKLFPIVPKSKYLELIQYADEDEFEDITKLHEIAFYDKIKTNSLVNNLDENWTKEKREKQIIDYILEKINPYNIDTNLLSRIDEARTKYTLDKNQVETYEELIETISSFYLFVLKETNNSNMNIDEEKLQIEALNLFQKTYKYKNEYQQAIVNSLNGFEGGIRTILDDITKYIKTDTKENYVNAVINEIDPTNYEIKKSLIQEIMNREKGDLNINNELLIPDKYIDDYIEIIRTYSQSKEQLNKIFARL
ncbi:MAG: hypothetical protein HYS24_01520 [Ignavibacteriales bacterium]|nr:hypothetical protein [Ignavibacteriales bacterium]